MTLPTTAIGCGATVRFRGWYCRPRATTSLTGAGAMLRPVRDLERIDFTGNSSIASAWSIKGL